MQVRNVKYNSVGTIDCEIEHPEFGWIPFTASPTDPEPLGVEIFTRAFDGSFGHIAPYEAPPYIRIVPPFITRFQARAALYQAGLLDDVNAMMSNQETDPIARLAWEDAQEFRRNSPTISAMAPALGLTESQVDDLFVFGSTIVA